jgi:putative FmdB family regulatory protein
MPTYDYECKACGHVFETMHAMSAPALKKCPECGKSKLVRLISGGAGVIFKGAGFYETDYKAKRGGGAGKDESKSDEKKKDEAAETAKPAPKPEPKSDVKSDAKEGGKAKKDASPKKG